MRSSYTSRDYTEERLACEKGFSELQEYPYLAAMKLARKVTQVALGMTPGTLGYSWGDQVYRSSVSVAANMAEGVGRITLAQKVQFLRTSRGSAYETITHLRLCPLDLDLQDLVKDYESLLKDIDQAVLRLIDQA